MMNNSKDGILYWPGRGNNPLQLYECLRIMEREGHSVEVMPFRYDVGTNPDNPQSCIYQWAIERTNAGAYWWIGLSLGAAIAHIVASVIPIGVRPRRITLINPFADRAQLAKEKNFSLQGQWSLNPVEYKLCVPYVDLVLSLQDDRIPNEHGKRLLPHINAEKVQVIMLNADHAVQCHSIQSDLAKVLLWNEMKGALGQYGNNVSCDIYKRKRNING